MRRSAGLGFTLIEMMAVLLIFGLLAGFLIPRVSAITGRRLHEEAEDLAGQLELARQRAVVTGVPHRVLIDLQSHGYRVEWLAASEDAPAPVSVDDLDLRSGTPVPMAPPPSAERSYQPIPTTSGIFHWLDDSISVEGIDTPEGWIEEGDASVDFDVEGTATATSIHLADTSGNAVIVEVLPLAESVRISNAE